MSEKPIGPLRQRMLEDMSVRGFTPDTQREHQCLSERFDWDRQSPSSWNSTPK
jgi:hypothetical protein